MVRVSEAGSTTGCQAPSSIPPVSATHSAKLANAETARESPRNGGFLGGNVVFAKFAFGSAVYFKHTERRSITLQYFWPQAIPNPHQRSQTPDTFIPSDTSTHQQSIFGWNVFQHFARCGRIDNRPKCKGGASLRFLSEFT